MENTGIVFRARNFYGALKVGKGDTSALGEWVPMHTLTNGGTLHGEQARGHAAAIEKLPTTYYGPLAGGLAVMLHEKWSDAAREKIILRDIDTLTSQRGTRPLRVGAIGLGIGTMATWARAGDDWRFFEINPLVDHVARDKTHFTYMAKSAAAPRTILGDARLMLEKEAAAGDALYDVLIVDAYSGDSVPLHLATEEAFLLYAKRLAPDGILAVHISNWHLDLMPLCKAAARALGMHAVGVESQAESENLIEGALWVYLSRQKINIDAAQSGADLIDFSQVRDIRLPTDSWGSLQGLIRFNYNVPVVADEQAENE